MGKASLCSRCQSLHIPSIFRSQRYENEEDMIYSEELDIRIASIAELKNQRGCQLCQLLIAIYNYELTDHNTAKEEEVEHFASRKDPRRVYCKLRPIRADILLKYDPCGVENQIATQLLIEFDPAVPVMFQSWDQDRADAKRGEVGPFTYNRELLYRGWTIALDHQFAMNGRLLLNRSSRKNELIDVWQLRSLLNECKRSHPMCNEKVEIATRGSKTRHIMLLDVSDRRIVCADFDTCYVALSYVWDYVDRDGYPGFKEGFPEGSIVPKLPCIMEDAIEIVQQLGEKYLWIDLLCIEQNNPVMKKIQIKQMDVVYSHAQLTIVVLARSNVHQGIPGIRPGSRKVEHYSVRIEGQSLVVGTIWNHFYTIAGSTWNTRGWTLEEGMLSRRCLIFGPNEMFFDCRSGVGSETLGLPTCRQSSQKMISLQHSPNLIDFKFWNKSFPKGWSFSFYAQSLRFYSERDLSHPRDSLNAFLGVLSRLTLTTGMEFVHGLPKAEILKGLLWFPSMVTSRLLGFPSWTWAGWTGPRSYCAAYREIIDHVQEGGSSSIDLKFRPRLAEAVTSVMNNSHTCITISSEVRQFHLLSAAKNSAMYLLLNSKGELILQLLGSHGPHDQQPYCYLQQGLLHLDAHADSASELTHFLYLVHWKDPSKPRDHILAMLIKEIDNGVFERIALCGIPVQEWYGAPIVVGLENVVLV